MLKLILTGGDSLLILFIFFTSLDSQALRLFDLLLGALLVEIYISIFNASQVGLLLQLELTIGKLLLLLDQLHSLNCRIL